jgi:hypothetical protein
MSASDFRRQIGAMLRRVEKLGPRAYQTAISLLDANGLSLADIEDAVRKVPSVAINAAPTRTHGVTCGEPAQHGEEQWFKQAREAAKAAWAKAHGYPVLDARQIAVHRQFSDIARQAAAGRLYDDEGRKRFCGDELDEAAIERGASAARRLMGKL